MRTVFLFGLLMVCISCVDDPTIEIEASQVSGMAPLTVNFKATVDEGKKPFSFDWDFGDGQGGGQQNISHIYDEAGTYNVTVQVTDSVDNTATATTSIEVKPNEEPWVSLSVSPATGDAPLTVKFVADVINGELPFTFLWKFGDGEESIEHRPVHVFNTPGIYNVSLKATDATGESIDEVISIEVGGEVSSSEGLSYGKTSGTIETNKNNFSTEKTAFTVIVMPDTQEYSSMKPQMFADQTDWIVDNREALNIQFVVHVGDLIGEEEDAGEWDIAVLNMDKLFDRVNSVGISYGVSFGNHDFHAVDGLHFTDTYNLYFPLSLFESMPGYAGSFDNTSDNFYFKYNLSGLDMIFMFLEFGPRDQVLAWAKDVADEHSNVPIFLSTHAYLDAEGFLLGTEGHENKNPLLGYGLDKSSTNDAVGIWQKLVYPCSNIRYVVSGHVGTETDGAANLNTGNSKDLSVYQMFSNYQYFPIDDSGYIRILQFRPDDNTVTVSTYAPTFDKYLTDPENHFEIRDSTLFI